MHDFHITLENQSKLSLVEQIVQAIRQAIYQGQIYPGARLPSWRDLSAQLGVARGTVRAAYERLTDEQLICAQGAAGTFVHYRQLAQTGPAIDKLRTPLPTIYRPPFSAMPLPFQIGVPAQAHFPHTLWARLARNAASQTALAAVSYPDPRGEITLRSEIAAHLCVARGFNCAPEQILITTGYSGALGVLCHALKLAERQVWLEDPAYPLPRQALDMLGAQVVPVPVDEQGLIVSQGRARAPTAALAIVTAGQHAPLGVTMTPARRQALLAWAKESGAWILEDDYLSELQLIGRAAPALAAQDDSGRVIYAGTFSKTISPALRLGFLVLPVELISPVSDIAAALAPAPSLVHQWALAEFMRKGHYLRHLRKMKRLYRAQAQALQHQLALPADTLRLAGLALLLPLAENCDDAALAQQALSLGLAPAPLSPWYAQPSQAPRGLLLGITNLPAAELQACCHALRQLLYAHALLT
ncbi:MAG: PLP-dependent aminotransferase family protein [Aeromonas sp.]